MGEQRAERAHADRPAEAAEEGDQRAAGADVPAPDAVLHDEHEVLHDHPESRAEHEHERGDVGQARRLVDRPHQRQAGGEQQGPGEHEALVAAGARDPAPDQRRREEQADDHGDREQPRLGRRLAARDLHVLAQEHGRAEHRDADGDARHHGEHDGAVAEQAQRDQRLAHAALHRHRDGAQPGAERDERGGLPRGPGVLLPGERDPDEQARDAAGDQQRARGSRSARGGGAVGGPGCAAARRTPRRRTGRRRRSTSASRGRR